MLDLFNDLFATCVFENAQREKEDRYDDGRANDLIPEDFPQNNSECSARHPGVYELVPIMTHNTDCQTRQGHVTRSLAAVAFDLFRIDLIPLLQAVADAGQ